MTELIVALDYSSGSEAKNLISQLSGRPVIWKVGLELFTAEGPSWVRALTDSGARVFLDLKLYDIPNTVAKAVAQAGELNVEFLTLHLSGGAAMLNSSVEILKRFKSPPRLLGVSVLTSFSEDGWNEVSIAISGQKRPISESATALVGLGSKVGVTGIVCSADELKILKQKYPRIYAVVPGIRPAGGHAQDQARVVTPSEAARRGADAIVVGRPITQAVDPGSMTDLILDELRSACNP